MKLKVINKGYKNAYITKSYPKENLLDSHFQISKRINLINHFNIQKYPALLKTRIILDDKNQYIYTQAFFQRIRIVASALKKEDFFCLVSALNYLKKIDFVHGDINKKNIIYTKDGFKIIDYEPSLLQIKNNVKQLMITMPYVLKTELDTRCVSTTTDKIGFFYFVLLLNFKLVFRAAFKMIYHGLIV